MRNLNSSESSILRVLLKSQRFMTTTEIAENAKISWNTANKYLKKMTKKGWLKEGRSGGRIYFKAIRNEY